MDWMSRPNQKSRCYLRRRSLFPNNFCTYDAGRNTRTSRPTNFFPCSSAPRHLSYPIMYFSSSLIIRILTTCISFYRDQNGARGSSSQLCYYIIIVHRHPCTHFHRFYSSCFHIKFGLQQPHLV